MFENKLIYWAIGAIVLYILFRITLKYFKPRESEYEKQLNDILTSDKYKVKGKHEN